MPATREAWSYDQCPRAGQPPWESTIVPCGAAVLCVTVAVIHINDTPLAMSPWGSTFQ
jgi:hypothetical protein